MSRASNIVGFSYLRDALHNSGVKSSADIINEELSNRRSSDQLIFVKYRTFGNIMNNIVSNNLRFDDSKAYYSEDGVFTLKDIVENNLAQGMEIKFSKTLNCYECKDISDSRRVESLLNVLREVGSIEDRYTKIISEINDMSLAKTIKLLESVVDNMTHFSSKSYCVSEGISFNKEKFDKMNSVKDKFSELLNILKEC